MRKYSIFGSITVAVLLAFAAPALAGSIGDPTDFTLFDQTGGDTSARCRSTTGDPFEFNASVRAINDDAVMRVTFRDGDFIDYPIPQDTSFSLHQIAGTDVGVDNRLIVTAAPGSVGVLVGWLSAASLADDGEVLCRTDSVV